MPAGRALFIAAAMLLGAAVGIGLFTFVYAKGASYLADDPQACANCHVMSEHFAAWTRASHHAVATCNDCHTPHTPVGKYVVKARNGFWHSFYFTTGGFPDPLRITEGNRQVTEGACRHCHYALTEAIDHSDGDVPRWAAISVHTASANQTGTGAQPISCVRCHPHVGHWVR